MNRVENRRKAREEQKQATYNLTANQIQTMKRDVAKDAAEKAFIMTLGVPCMVLKDKYGFGKKRLSQFVAESLELLDSVHKGYVTIKDMEDCLKSETGFDVNERL